MTRCLRPTCPRLESLSFFLPHFRSAGNRRVTRFPCRGGRFTCPPPIFLFPEIPHWIRVRDPDCVTNATPVGVSYRPESSWPAETREDEKVKPGSRLSRAHVRRDATDFAAGTVPGSTKFVPSRSRRYPGGRRDVLPHSPEPKGKGRNSSVILNPCFFAIPTKSTRPGLPRRDARTRE